MEPIAKTDIPIEIKKHLEPIHSISFPRQGYTSDVGIIECGEKKYALKRTVGEEFCYSLNKEVFALQSLTNQTSLPIPKVHAFLEQTTQHESWALLEFMEGATVRAVLANEKNKAKRQEILFHFGKMLSQIHATPCPPELKYQQKWLPHMLHKAAFNLENYTVDGSKELLNMIISNPLLVENQTLIHGDYTIDNVLVLDGVVTAVIDWGGATYGDPRYDVSLAIRPKPNIFEHEIDKAIFFEGYGEKIINEAIYRYYANGLYEFF